MGKAVADHLAAKLNAKLNYTPSDEPHMVEDGGIFQKYEEELEINDFPQQARWKVTSKEALAQISEYSEAGITVRGTYYGPGKAIPCHREHPGAVGPEGQGGDHQATEGRVVETPI